MSASFLSSSKQKSVLYLASSLCDGLEDNDLKQLTTLLTNKDADPNVLMPLHGITPFHLVIGNESETFAEEVTKLFLRHGGNPNVKSVDGMTPVHVAAAWGRTTILELLLSNGGDPLCLDTDYCSPIHYALQGNHYEAVQLLSQYCMTEEPEDDKPKFKRELDKVLVNNGEVLAEYIVSDDSLFDSSDKLSISSSINTENSCIDTSGYAAENGSTDAVSLNNEFVTMRRRRRKVLADENYNFDRKTVEEEQRLINEIIAQLSSSIASDVDNCSATYQKNENEYEYISPISKASSPKRKQITMTFNRPKKNNELHDTVKKETSRRRSSTLQVIKQHNNIPQLKNNAFLAKTFEKSTAIPDKNFSTRKSLKTLTKNVTPKKESSDLSQFNRWLDETIISKSPNLTIKPKEKKNKLFKTPVFEKKVSSVSRRSPNNPSPKTPTPVSRIPRPKKYFTTPSNLRTVKRTAETPTKTVIPNKRKAESSKKASSSQRSTPVNKTYNKSNTSTPRSSSQSQYSNSDRGSIKKIAMKLDDCMYDNEDDDFIKGKTSSTVEEKSAHDRYVSTFDSELARILPSELVSGVGVISRSASDSVSDKEELKSASDLNRAILDSVTSKSREEKILEENENSKIHDNAFDSLMCTRGSISSDSNDSFQSSLSKNDNIGVDNVPDNRKAADIKQESNLISPSNSFTSCRKFDSDTFVSIEEEYKYEDPEEGIVFLERRLCVTPSCPSSDMNSSYYSCSTAKSEPLPRELLLLDNIRLRERLKSLGENPGPITETTHRVYLKRLHKLESQGREPVHQDISLQPIVSIERERDLLKSSLLSIEWIQNLDDYESSEQKIFKEFDIPNPTRKWREGTSKSSFNYLLLDPRITDDLPRRASKLTMTEKWSTFLSAIFYVGKGKRSRPYAHLYDAFKIWVAKNRRNGSNTRKIQRILDIWNEGRGVVVLHVFHNTIPVEAYTREAAMIEALGTQKLGNCKNGDYYGVVATWRPREKCEFGRYLLFKALQIFLVEGERQIFPDNL